MPPSVSPSSSVFPSNEPNLAFKGTYTIPPNPSFGTLTWNAEGQADPSSRYYSRNAHLPSSTSGITIGRGYDLKQHSEAEILRDFTAAGLSPEQSILFANVRSLSGGAARTFLSGVNLPELSSEQEQSLFQASWNSAFRDVQRISALPSVVQVYGAIDWTTTDPAVRDLIVDLRYRGDYTPATRAFIQSAVAQNDLESLSKVLSNRSLWAAVPPDRFERRRQAALEALGAS